MTLECGVTPPLGYSWGTNAAFDAWRAGTARLACAAIDATVARGAAWDRLQSPARAQSSARVPGFLQGFATRYGKPHYHKGRVEVFARGCFARSLVASAPAVRFLVKHRETELLGTTADGLELMQDENGLAFRLRLPNTDHGREIKASVSSRALCGMSVGYRIEAEETKMIEGVDVRIIRDAWLDEISLCVNGAVSQAYAVAIDAAGAPTFAHAVKSRAISSDGAAVGYLRTLGRLRDVLDRAA